MSNKFNELIELFIAEEQDKAKEMFHEIVVEKSRDIYESLLNDESKLKKKQLTKQLKKLKSQTWMKNSAAMLLMT